MERLDRADLHPASKQVVRFFAYDHLPENLQEISKPFGDLALHMAILQSGPEVTVGLRKLLESKDCMVRAGLPSEGYPLVGRDGEQRGPEGFNPGVD